MARPKPKPSVNSWQQGQGNGVPGLPSQGVTNWNQSNTQAAIDATDIPIVDPTTNNDPLNLASLFQTGPNVPDRTIGARIASVAKMSQSQVNDLGNVLANAGVISASKSGAYTTKTVQSALDTAMRQTGESGAGNLSNYLVQRTQQQAPSGADTVAPSPNVSQTVYTPQDLTGQVDAVAQKLVGRNATPDEIQAITDQLNSAAASNTQQQITKGEQNVAGNQQAAAAAKPGTVDSFLAAIRQHESNGNYQANSGDGAYGAYQYIPSTWNSEATAAGYGQFANGRADQAPPAVQDAVARFNAQNLYNHYGSWEMSARAWYDPAYVNQPGYAPPGNNGLTIGAYGQDIINIMGAENNGVATATTPAVSNAGTIQANPKASAVIAAATGQLGVPYQWGAEQKGKAFDCSGLVQYVMGTQGINVPRVAQNQFNATQKIAPSQLAPGDLLFFGKDDHNIGHVGIYIGNGQMIDAPHTGAKVRVEAVPTKVGANWGSEKLVGMTAPAGAGVQGPPANFAALADAAAKGGTAYLTQLNQQGSAAATSMTDNSNNATITDVQPASATSPTDAAESYYRNQKSGDYQSNNLVNVFKSIQNRIGATPENINVRTTPVVMK